MVRRPTHSHARPVVSVVTTVKRLLAALALVALLPVGAYIFAGLLACEELRQIETQHDGP